MCPDVHCIKIEADTSLCMALDAANCCIDHINMTDKHRCVYGMFFMWHISESCFNSWHAQRACVVFFSGLKRLQGFKLVGSFSPKTPKAFEWPQVADPQPTSVVSSPKDWREESLLVPHEAIRWWGREVSKILDEFDPVSRSTCVWKTKIFFDFLESYYIPCIHHHHDSEEKIYNVHILKNVKLRDCQILLAPLRRSMRSSCPNWRRSWAIDDSSKRIDTWHMDTQERKHLGLFSPGVSFWDGLEPPPLDRERERGNDMQ